MYRIAILEDEPQAEKVLAQHLARYGKERGEDYQVVWYSSALEFEETKQQFDLIFMDIQMPGITGMEAAQTLRMYDVETPIIFVTNLAQYAIKGYEVDALDFIVKPVTYGDFRMRMDRAMRHVRRTANQTVVINTREGVRVVPVSEIEYLEVSNHSLVYHLWSEEEPLTMHGSLAKAEQELAGGPFVRISNNCLVNMNQIRSVRGMEIKTRGGDSLYLSRSRKKEAVATITSFLGGSL